MNGAGRDDYGRTKHYMEKIIATPEPTLLSILGLILLRAPPATEVTQDFIIPMRFDCWYKTVGQCIFKDDMQILYPKFRDADILVLAIPVYIPLPGEMQNLINRLCPIIEPAFEFCRGRTRVRFSQEVRISKIVLVSTCGWWEMGNFGPCFGSLRNSPKS